MSVIPVIRARQYRWRVALGSGLAIALAGCATAQPEVRAPASPAAIAPATAHDFALLGPDYATGAVDPAVRQAVLARAETYLPRAPNPAEHIRIEGVSSGQVSVPGVESANAASASDREAAKASLTDMEAMFDLALAWRLTAEQAYLEQSLTFLDAWVSTYSLSFNPIDEGRFDRLILTYDLVEAEAPEAMRAEVDAFLRQMARGYIEAMEAGDVPIKPTLTNNWQSHRIKLATLAAFQIGDGALIDRAHVLFDRHIDANLRADGSTLDFAQRDALHYVTYSLTSQLIAAAAAREHGQNWYSYVGPEGQSLSKTLDWLGQYADGSRTHVEFANSRVPFDRQRAAEGNATFQNNDWNPTAADQVMLLASLFDRKWRRLADDLYEKAVADQTKDSEDAGPVEWITLL